MNEKFTVDEKYIQMSKIKEPVYVKVDPFVSNEGIWMPECSYVREDVMPAYRLVIPKELFVEAYNMWIKGAEDNEAH